jgi:hypothetical protein
VHGEEVLDLVARCAGSVDQQNRTSAAPPGKSPITVSGLSDRAVADRWLGLPATTVRNRSVAAGG